MYDKKSPDFIRVLPFVLSNSNFISTSWLWIDFCHFEIWACNRGHKVVDGLRKLLKPQQRNITISINKPWLCKFDLWFKIIFVKMCYELLSIPHNDRLTLAKNFNTRACLVIKQAFLWLDLNNDSFIHDLAIWTGHLASQKWLWHMTHRYHKQLRIKFISNTQF